MPNVRHRPIRDLSSYRRIAAVAWDQPRDPTIYGTMEIRAQALLDWLDAQNAAAPKGAPRLTITHAVARAIAKVVDQHREVNAYVRWGRLVQREEVDIFLQVVVKHEDLGKVDLSGVTIRAADTKDIHSLAAEVKAGARKIRKGDDADFEQTKGMAKALPGLVLRLVLRVMDSLQWFFNIDTTFLGAPRDPFGVAQITSVGMLGLKRGFAPFFPLARSPILIMVGAVDDEVVAVDGQPKVAKVLTLNATLDHRVIDGYHAAILSKEITDLLEHPEGLG